MWKYAGSRCLDAAVCSGGARAAKGGGVESPPFSMYVRETVAQAIPRGGKVGNAGCRGMPSCGRWTFVASLAGGGISLRGVETIQQR